MKPKNKASEDLKRITKSEKYQTLAHLLSPIELEALKHHYFSFNYQIDGVTLPISHITCRHLKEFSLAKVKIYASLFNKKNLPTRLKTGLFLEVPLEHFGFTTQLKHSLQSIECYSMLEIIATGRKHIFRARGIGKLGLAQIDAVMKKQGCLYLFSE